MNENLNNQNFNNNAGQQMGGMVGNNQPGNGNNIVNELLQDKPRLIGLIGALVAIIGNFLPYVVMEMSLLGTTYSESMSYWAAGTGGKVIFFLSLAIGVLYFLKKQPYIIALLGYFLVQFLYNLINLSDLAGTYSSIEIKWGIGIYVTILGFGAMCVGLYLYWKDNKNCFKDLINKFKNKNNPPVAQPNSYSQQPVQSVNQPVQPQPMDNSMMNQPMNNGMMNQPMNDQNMPMNNNQNNNF